MASGDLVVKISAETKKFDDAIKSIESQTEDLEEKLTSVAKVSGAAFAAIVAGAGFAVTAFADSQKAARNLEVALQNQGLAGKGLTKTYNDLAAALQKKTGVDDDAVVSGLAVLQGFVGQQEISEDLASSMVDLAEKTGSVESASEILGRAVNGNVRGLKQFGITIDETLPRQERIAAITDAVSQKFGGLAESTNKGLGGFRGLQNAFGNFVEQIGARVAPLVEVLIQKLTSFFTVLSENGPLLDFIFEVGKIAAIVTGAVAALSSGGIALVKLVQAIKIAQAAWAAFGIATKLALGATGLGLVLIVVAEVALNWNKIWPVMVAVYETFANNIANITSGIGTLLSGVFRFDVGAIKEGFNKIVAVVEDGSKRIAASRSSEDVAGKEAEQNEAKLAQAKAANEELLRLDRLRTAQSGEEQQLRVLQQQNASQELLSIQQQEIDNLKAQQESETEDEQNRLKERLAVLLQLEADARATQILQKEQYQTEILAKDAEFQRLDETQKTLFLEKQARQLQNSILTEQQAKMQALAQRQKDQIDADNRFVQQKEQFGAAVATLDMILNSQQIKGFQQTNNQLLALQNSKNKELKAIGKAAAVADITIKTAQGALAAYTGMIMAIPFPPVAIPLGIAAAAAVVAYGAEQIGSVLSAQSGGIVPGANMGGDSVPAILQPGELVVPRANFSEVVNAVASARVNDSAEATSGISTPAASAQRVDVSLEFSGDNAEKFLTARQVESRSLGTIREATA